MYAVMFLWLILYDFVEANVPLVNYWDELTAMLVFCWGAYSVWKNPKLQKQEWIDWICLTVLVVIGALGNVVHPGLQEAKVAMVKDVVALIKFPAILLILSRRSVAPETQEKMIADIAKIGRIFVAAAMLGIVVGRFCDLGFYTGEVRIVSTYQFVFSHPSFYISSCVMVAAGLIAESIRKNRVFLLLDCLLIFMAQRSKGYIFVAFLLMVIVLGENRMTKLLTLIFGSGKEKIKWGRLLLATAVLGLAIYVVGKPRIEQHIYIGYPVPRIVLHLVGITVLMDFFPLGSGFGTFASYLSGRYYSNIYELYGISDVFGMTREKYNFISDVFWPYIYGQFGIFGLMIYVKLIFSLFIRQFRARLTDGSRLAVAVVWLYALIASTSEAYFTNGTGVQMALFLSLIIGYGELKTVTE